MLLWVFAIVAGARILLNYESTPGRAGHATSMWPAKSRIERKPGKFSLVMLLHPDCPCSQASVTELGRLMAQLHGRLSADVVFFRPGLLDKEVQTASLWKRAAAIPDTVAFNDSLGRETALFGGAVSGEAMLYDAQGKLRFHGGITASRGHEGDNPGSDAILALVRGEMQAFVQTPTFGCSLNDPDRQELKDPAWKKQ
jgi:hypothetical protein